MFFKNKKEIEKTPEDNKLYDLYIKILGCSSRLKKQVYKIITLNNVIEIYPNGADKSKAIKDANEAKEKLLCIIGEYDDKRRQYMDYFSKTQNQRIYTNDYTSELIDSHKIIENAYKYYYKYELR